LFATRTRKNVRGGEREGRGEGGKGKEESRGKRGKRGKRRRKRTCNEEWKGIPATVACHNSLPGAHWTIDILCSSSVEDWLTASPARRVE
jgi:hypothetical protein